MANKRQDNQREDRHWSEYQPRDPRYQAGMNREMEEDQPGRPPTHQESNNAERREKSDGEQNQKNRDPQKKPPTPPSPDSSDRLDPTGSTGSPDSDESTAQIPAGRQKAFADGHAEDATTRRADRKGTRRCHRGTNEPDGSRTTSPAEDNRSEGSEAQDNNSSRQRDGALGYGNTPGANEVESDSAASNGDSGREKAMSESHDSGSEPCADEFQPAGFLREEVLEPKPANDVFDDVIQEAHGNAEEKKFPPVGRRLLAHVYYCSTRLQKEYQRGVPVEYRLFKRACRQAREVPVPTRTEKVWRPLEEAGFLKVTDHIYREEGVGRSRGFHLAPDLRWRLTRAVEEGHEYSTRYNLVTGNRSRSTTKTNLTYDGDHSWKERSSFIYKTLKTLRGQRDLVNKEAVETHLSELRRERNRAKARYEKAKDHFFELLRDCCDVHEEDGEETWTRKESLSPETKAELDRRQKTCYRVGREYNKISDRYDQDVRIWSDITGQGLEQAEDMPDGIFQYETAYEVQVKSGRLTMLVGLQNASSEMKAAAARGIPNYRDMDIKSSQTEALIQEMKMAVRMGAELDVTVLTEYEGKDSLAEHFGIDRDLWKRPEHGGKFGAMFNYERYEDARRAAEGKVIARIGTGEDDEPNWERLHQLAFETGKMSWERAVYNALPTMAQTARDWADDPEIDYDDLEAIYSMLKDAFEEMTEEIDRWREWLVDEHWTQAGQHGSRGQGYYVENPCGLAFSIHQDEFGDRYDQKAGYATSRLQGLEAAYMHALTLIQEDFDYEVLRNEHDGAIVLGRIPREAREMARLISGFHRAELEEKPFDDDRSSDANNIAEDTSCEFDQTRRNTPARSDTKRARSGGSGSPDTQTESRSGAPTRNRRSGSPRRSRPPSRPGTGSSSRAGNSASSTDRQPGKPNGSKTSSGPTTGNTSRNNDSAKPPVERVPANADKRPDSRLPLSEEERIERERESRKEESPDGLDLGLGEEVGIVERP